jgi:signal transduction histidine kinase
MHPRSTAIAAYVTWAAVAYSLWADGESRLSAIIPMGMFLLAFMLRSPPTGNHFRPAAVALLACSALGLLVSAAHSLSPVLLIIVAAVLFVAYPARVAWASLVAINSAFLAILLWQWRVSNPMNIFTVYAGFQVFAATTTSAQVWAEATADELRRTNAELLATRSLLAESARDGERLRVSRELHDVAGHKLTALALNLEILDCDSTLSGRHELQAGRQLTRELLADVRSVVSHLRCDDGLDLRHALERVAEVFPRPTVHLEIGENSRAAGAEQAQTLLRVAQEALTNAARHSSANNVWLRLHETNSQLEMGIEDDGRFAGTFVVGNGLAGMRERIELLGGTLDVGIGAQGGFRVTARLRVGRNT